MQGVLTMAAVVALTASALAGQVVLRPDFVDARGVSQWDIDGSGRDGWGEMDWRVLAENLDWNGNYPLSFDGSLFRIETTHRPESGAAIVRLLGVEKYHLYDNTIPIYKVDRRYPYDEAKRIVLESVAPLGAAYQEKMRSFVSRGRIDVYENEGKRSGAYNAGVYGVGPYLLLNYNDTVAIASALP